MSQLIHLVHGLDAERVPADWPALDAAEVATVLQRYREPGAPMGLAWHSPRPLSAAALVETTNGRVFVKRHHRQVRSVSTLGEEHRFMAHLRTGGLPVPRVLMDGNGQTAVALGDWVYEVHDCAAGVDIYREKQSWSPLEMRGHAVSAGAMLATLHKAAAGYRDDDGADASSQRSTHLLVARSELLGATDMAATLRAQLAARPALAAYLEQRDWPADLHHLQAAMDTGVTRQLAQQAPLWTHGDWHVSNLCWSGPGPEARVMTVIDFGLCARTFALFDLATAIERNAIAWLALETGDAAVHVDIALALIEGYGSVRQLSRADIQLLADLLPRVHIDFALSEVDYFYGVLKSRSMADVAYDTFLLGHSAWFGTPAGQFLLQAIRERG